MVSLEEQKQPVTKWNMRFETPQNHESFECQLPVTQKPEIKVLGFSNIQTRLKGVLGQAARYDDDNGKEFSLYLKQQSLKEGANIFESPLEEGELSRGGDTLEDPILRTEEFLLSDFTLNTKDNHEVQHHH